MQNPVTLEKRMEENGKKVLNSQMTFAILMEEWHRLLLSDYNYDNIILRHLNKLSCLTSLTRLSTCESCKAALQ